MNKSSKYFILFLPAAFLLIFPNYGLAVTQEELEGKVIDIAIATFHIRQEVDKILYSLPPFLEVPLSDYLKELFESNGILLTEDDFLVPTRDPYLDFAKMLNLIPDSFSGDKMVNKYLSQDLNRKIVLIKDKIFIDGLLGKIDMHEHYRTGGDMEAFLQAAGGLGISKILFVPTGWGPDNKGYKIYQKFLLRYIKKLYPEKVIAFCTIDEQDPNASEDFENCLREGGQGLKLLGGHPNFYDEPLDSDNMYKVYKIAEKYEVPVLIHGSIINIKGLKEQLERVFADFPKVTFIHAHYCSAIFNGINLNQCAEILDKYPNVYIDLSMGGGIARYHRYLREDLEKIKDFVVKYQDRILFGSDIILDEASYKTVDWISQRMRCDIDLHQKSEYSCPFGEADRSHKGFQFPREILFKLYYENPSKVLM